ncbi:putative RtcB family protein [Bacillus phage vB_BspH_TimeGriffin]|nr:putative RtcB family protein [Bacillus phage vB_BspH_TimeGriffin]
MPWMVCGLYLWGTLDEALKVYIPMEAILGSIEDSLIVNKAVKPVYNFKAV